MDVSSQSGINFMTILKGFPNVKPENDLNDMKNDPDLNREDAETPAATASNVDPSNESRTSNDTSDDNKSNPTKL